MANVLKPGEYLIVKKGPGRIRINDIPQPGVDFNVGDPNRPLQKPIYIQFIHWDVDSDGIKWGAYKLSEEVWEEQFKERAGEDILPQFETFESTLQYFSRNAGFKFADAINTGETYPNLRAYRERMEQIKNQYASMFSEPTESEPVTASDAGPSCRHEGCNSTVGLDENGYCRWHRDTK